MPVTAAPRTLALFAPVLEVWSEVTADRDLTVSDPGPFTLEFTPREFTWQLGLETPNAEVDLALPGSTRRVGQG